MYAALLSFAVSLLLLTALVSLRAAAERFWWRMPPSERSSLRRWKDGRWPPAWQFLGGACGAT